MIIRSLDFIKLGALAGLCVGAAACTAEVAADETVGTTEDAVIISPPANSNVIIYGYMWTWLNNGSTPLQLPVPAFPNSACFLTNLWGKFLSSSDIVKVSVNAQLNWILGGASGGGTPSADAWCITNTAMSIGQEATWTSGLPVNMPKPGGSGFAGSSDSCFLTGIRGNVSNWGSDTARLRIVSGVWQLDAKAGVQVFARCINRPPFAEATIMVPNSSGIPGGNGWNANNPATDSPYFCALTRVHGSLRGGWIGTYLVPPTDDEGFQWIMSGSHNPGFFPIVPIGASARCTW
jgi:hypothetical protein